MKRTMIFASRCAKEILRDKLTVFFGLGFPIIILLLLSLLQRNIPVEMFEIGHLTPGICVFGLSFISLFSGMLVAKDRDSSLLMRLMSTPLTSRDYILGYCLPLIPVSLMQIIVCCAVAMALGLKFSVNILLMLAVMLPAIIVFIAIGLICGSIFSDKQVGGMCGALLTNLTAWLSGIWFDTAMLGKGFSAVAKALPFYNAVEAGRSAMSGDYAGITVNLLIVSAYALALTVIAVLVFKSKMKQK